MMNDTENIDRDFLLDENLYVEYLKKRKNEEEDDDDGSYYRNKFRELRILFLILKKLKYKIKNKKLSKQAKKQNKKELLCINNIISIILNDRLSLQERITRLNRVPVISPLIFEIKKEAIQQLKIMKKIQKEIKKNNEKGLENGILGIKFKGVSKILNAPLTSPILEKREKNRDLLCKKGTNKVRRVNDIKKTSKKSTKVLKETELIHIGTNNHKKTSIGHFTSQELKRRELNYQNQYNRNI